MYTYRSSEIHEKLKAVVIYGEHGDGRNNNEDWGYI